MSTADTRPALLAAAVLLVVAAFLGGWLVGRAGVEPDFTLVMEGTPAAVAAHADLDVYPIDEAGNWPMKMRISGLADGRYGFVLTRDGKPAVSCGFFLVQGLDARLAERALQAEGVRRLGR